MYWVRCSLNSFTLHLQLKCITNYVSSDAPHSIFPQVDILIKLKNRVFLVGWWENCNNKAQQHIGVKL